MPNVLPSSFLSHIALHTPGTSTSANPLLKLSSTIKKKNDGIIELVLSTILDKGGWEQVSPPITQHTYAALCVETEKTVPDI